MNRQWIATVVAVAGTVIANGAFAHIVLAVREAPAGSYFKAVFQVPHGCEGAATTAIEIDLPEGIVVAKPAPNPGWKLTIAREALARPIINEGHELKERVKSVRWEGGKLPDDEFGEFTIMVRLPAEAGRISFPVVQVCGTSRVDWVQSAVPDGSGKPPPRPAPSVTLTKSGDKE